MSNRTVSIILIVSFLIISLTRASSAQDYEDIVAGMFKKEFKSVEVLYLDDRITGRVPFSPTTMTLLACKFNLSSESKEWENLTEILRDNIPWIRSSEQYMGDVRWGLILTGEKKKSEIYIGSYFGLDMDSNKRFGIINGSPVFFPGEITKKIRLLLDSVSCTDCGMGLLMGKC